MTEWSAVLVCPACGSRAGWDGAVGELHRCRACGFIAYLGAAAGALTALYDDRYFNGGEYADYLGEEAALRRSMRNHLQQMSRHPPKGRRLLEIGCAYGLFLDEARREGFEVTGLDICAGPLSHGRHQLGLDTRCADFRTVDLGRAAYDTVCLWDTIEHLPDPDHFVARARDLLTCGGMLYLTTGDMGSLNARLRGARWRQIHPPTHVSYFTRSSMRRMLERLGFEVVAVETAGYYHTLYNVLASFRMRGGTMGRAASGALAILGAERARRIGGWINLGDTMFVAARRTEEGTEDRL